MQIQEQLKIQADRQRIFAYMNDISNRTAYIPMLEEVILLEEPPIKLGSRYIEVASIAGQKLKTTYEVTELQAPEQIKVKTIQSVFPIEVTLTLEALPNATLLTMTLDFTLKGVYKLAAPLVKGIVQQQAKDILGRLKGIFEQC